MDKDELILTGQGEQQNVPKGLDTSVANDLLGDVQRSAQPAVQRVGASVGKYGTGAGAKPIVKKETKAEQKKIANERFVGGMSGRVKGLINSPGFTGDNAMYDTDQIANRRNIAYIPELYDSSLNRDVVYAQDFTSDTGTIIKDSARQFWMSLGTLGDKALIGLGGITSQITGNEFGVEMRDRAYDTLTAKLYNMGLVASEAADVETLTSKITMGAASMLEMMALGMMTGGIAPLAQMGVDAFGEGTYNNMRKYADENGGSVEGFEGNWVDLGVDLANAAVQVAIERKLGVGSMRWMGAQTVKEGAKQVALSARGHFIKEAVNGFLQESSQELAGDFSEYLKGNENASIMLERWQDYLIAGAIGGVLQGSLGAATYKAARGQADAAATQMYVEVVGRANPNMASEKLQQEGRAFAKAFNDAAEQGIAQDMYQELADRADANNDRGRIRDSLVEQISKAKAASLGLDNVSELDAADLADIQDAATIIARESVRMAWAEGVAIQDTLLGRVYADGATLKIRDLTPGEAGVRAVNALDLAADNETLANAMAVGRDRARTDRESQITRVLIGESDANMRKIQNEIQSLQANAEDAVKLGNDIGKLREQLQKKFSQDQIDAYFKQYGKPARIQNKAKQISQRQLELGIRSRTDGKTAKQIETNIKAQSDQVLRDFVSQQYGYTNARYFSRGNLEDLALRQKNNWVFVPPRARETGEQVGDRLGRTQQRTVERVLDQDARDLASYAGIPIAAVEQMSDAEYKAFAQEQARRRANELDMELARQADGLEDIPDLEYQQSLKGVASNTGTDSGRGSYNNKYQEIILNKDSDISTILHEFSHLWLNSYFKAARADNAPEGFQKMWGAVEKELGIRPYERFLDKDISEKFARSFEKFVSEGGQGASETMQPIYERLSKRMADIYDGLATRYFDQIGDLALAVRAWFNMNENFVESLTGLDTKEMESERAAAMDEASNEARMQGNQTQQATALNNEVETAEPATPSPQSDTEIPMQSPYTQEGKKERAASKHIRDMATAKGILVDARSEYDPFASKTAAEDAQMMVQMDYDLAKDIAMGRKSPRGGIPAEIMFIAVRNKALINNDAYTLKMLQNSPVQARITEAAQRLSLVRNYTGNGEQNIVKMLKDIQTAYDKKISNSKQVEIAEQVQRLDDIIKRFDMESETAWDNMLKSMECK